MNRPCVVLWTALVLAFVFGGTATAGESGLKDVCSAAFASRFVSMERLMSDFSLGVSAAVASGRSETGGPEEAGSFVPAAPRVVWGVIAIVALLFLLFGALRLRRIILDGGKAERELLHLRSMLSNVEDFTSSVLVGVNEDGDVILWNARAERATGLEARMALGRPLASVFPRLGGEMERIDQAVRSRRVMAECRQWTRDDGETVYEDVIISPLAGNGATGALLRVDDVTGRVGLEQLTARFDRMSSVGGLAAGMAHELNNLLAGVLGYNHNIKRRIFSDIDKNLRVAGEVGVSLDKIREYLVERKINDMLDGIGESGGRAAKIVSDLLGFSRNGEERIAPCSPCALLDAALDLAAQDYSMKKKCGFREIEIVREYDPETPSIHCRPIAVQQVFLNLFKNGAEAMAGKEYGEEGPRFLLRVFPEGEGVAVEIEDNGPGMDKRTLLRAFDPFFSTKETAAGLGLPAARILAERHNGGIVATSSPGKGTRVAVTLPVGEKTN